MTTTLPVLPTPDTPVTMEALTEVERRLAVALPAVDDMDTLEEWRAQAAALVEYLRGRDLQAPMLGAQRRIEARIGQLLGAPIVGAHHSLTREGADVPKNERHDFRVLAHALDGDVEIAEDEWRSSRRALVAAIRSRLPGEPATNGTPPAPGKADAHGAETLTRLVNNTRSIADSLAGAATAPAVRAGSPEDAQEWLALIDEARAALQQARAQIRRYRNDA